MFTNVFLGKYQQFFTINILVLFFHRSVEAFLIWMNYGLIEGLIQDEILGFILDLSVTSGLLIVLYPLFFVVFQKSMYLAKMLFLFFIGTFSILHLIILKYYLYQLELLDIFLFQYPIYEIIFTIKTSESNLANLTILGIVFIIIFLFIIKLINYINYNKRLVRYNAVIIGFSILLNTILYSLLAIEKSKFMINKSIYFYSKSINYVVSESSHNQENINHFLNNFQKLDKSKKYLDSNYPLLHKFDAKDSLGKYFHEFDTIPNIVFLIVEGLNDDFIHDYKNVKLMPFLTELKDSSLYWNHNFTVGERSFAAVPSLLGSLPYGEIGFTILERLPRHVSLVNLLNSNGYYTSFFYGQGSWLHKKDRFFKFNNIDLIFDKNKFQYNYEKIVVGSDNFFWGYNDKELFQQSLEVIDTLVDFPRLDIYFTGTSHSPFRIAEETRYETKFNDLIKKISDIDSLMFFKTYKKFIKSIIFVDDALEEYVVSYKTLEEYENTIFIITGDHPMTEIPIANSLKRYHVPLIIYSDKIKKPSVFTNPVSHLDIYETLLAFLQNYGIRIPEHSTALGQTLFTGKENKSIIFMNNNREVIDYYTNDLFVSGNQLFKVTHDLKIEETVNEKIKEILLEDLSVFKKTFLYLSDGNNLLPDSIYCNSLNHNIVYSYQNIDKQNFNSGYHDLIPEIDVKNQHLIYDIYFEYEKNVSDLYFVYQLANQQDSILYWRSMTLDEDQFFLQSHINIPPQNCLDSTLQFKSYLWNKAKREINYSGLNLMLHSPK